MLHSQTFTLKGSQNRDFLLDVTFTKNGLKKPVIVFVHGFKGFKDWGHFAQLANYFANNNFVFVKFNFSHNGTTVNKPCDFADLNAFGNNNYVHELFDLNVVIDYLFSKNEIAEDMDLNEFYLIGHSRGGAIAIIRAIEDKRIKKLVTWAAVADVVNRNTVEQINEWQKNDVVYSLNSRTGQNLPMYKQFYDVIVNNKSRLNVIDNLKNLKIPYLIIHGSNDQAVLIDEAYLLKQNCAAAELFVVENGDHTFGGSHPWLSNILPQKSIEVSDKTIFFLNSIGSDS